MSDFHDRLETRDPGTRAKEQLAALEETLARAMGAPGWARQLAGVDPKSAMSRAALAKFPLLRKSDLVALQKAQPPFGGFNVTPPGKVKRLQMSPGPIFEPEGGARTSMARRARCSRPASGLAISCTIPSPIT